ncbi:polysaccharide biosynthesis protein [Qipengyuania sp. DSG2-2]|uniref:polysaccharide biosynthesis protein n=1 Tax=Qipengyuania sp. DGS2-2 TaxID=3349631 RepID=UPI0036D42C3B
MVEAAKRRIDGLTDVLLNLPRSAKRALALAVDITICVFSVWLAVYLRVGYWVPFFGMQLHPAVVSVVLALPLFVVFGLYRAIFRYAGAEAFFAIGRAVLIYSIPFAIIYTLIGVQGVPRTIGLIQPILLFLMVSGSRLLARMLFEESYTALFVGDKPTRVLIYGAGRAGRELAGAIATAREMQLVGFVDDDTSLTGSTLRGVTIYAPDALADVIERRKVDDVLLAMPQATRVRRSEVLQALRPLPVHVRTLPSMVDIARGTISVGDLREPGIEDLLGRSQIPPDQALLTKNITGKVVMVTGAGGSIGSELCRQILKNAPACLLLVDHSEFNLYTAHQEFAQMVALDRQGEADDPAPVLIPLLASVCDERRMAEILTHWQPATVIHAAAYKHVPLVEQNALEGVRNNVFGTYTVARLAQQHGVANLILVSTDKAVRPTNIMGATKRLAEMILQALQEAAGEGSATTFSMVRFGNVLGSSGSVIPLFREQIAAGGPVTITHPDITRYFMTIPEASQLVLQAGAMARGGDVFVLDMGEPVRIVDLARNMIELSGLTVRDDDTPDGDIALSFTGLRPAEKLYEELLIGENAQESQHPRIMRANESFLPLAELETRLEEMRSAIASGDPKAARDLLARLVPEYQPSTVLSDWTRQPS